MTSRLFTIHQVINAARTLAARPRSKVAKENMDVFRDAWINQVKVLTEAVDDITTIDDFLAVSGKLKLLEFFFKAFRTGRRTVVVSQPKNCRPYHPAFFISSWTIIFFRGPHS